MEKKIRCGGQVLKYLGLWDVRGLGIRTCAPLAHYPAEAYFYEVHTSFGAYFLEKWEFTQDFVGIAKLHERRCSFYTI
jgi:hypothetical protein